MTYSLKIAVRTLVEHVFRSGNLNLDFVGSINSARGILGHKTVQNNRPEHYTPEVTVSHEVDTGNFRLVINGRIDGVFNEPDDVVIEEIKTTTHDLDSFDRVENPVHWGQLKIYAFIYAHRQQLNHITGQLLYYNIETQKSAAIRKSYTLDELEAFFNDTINRYLQWAETVHSWHGKRDTAIERLGFPFPNYRPGQRHMAVAVFRAVRDGGQLLVQAATGIGKTMAALFPAIKTLSERKTSKLFYLTARTTGRMAAEKAIEKLLDNGLHLKALTLTAKDKICFTPDGFCTPDDCEFARGHFDRVNGALAEVFQHPIFNRRVIEETALKHRVCPFEFSLELSLWADCIICDYNYAFDPRVYLKRFFAEEMGDYAFLIDEAHNLVDRSRDMFSAAIDKETVLAVRREVKNDLPRIYQSLGKINQWLLRVRKTCEQKNGEYASPLPPDDLYPLLNTFVIQTDHWLSNNIKTPFRNNLLDLFFTISNFLKISERFDASYAVCCQQADKNVQVRLFCVDPADHMREALARCRSAVFFSATLAPAKYFQTLFGCGEQVKKIAIPSPFPKSNFKVFITDTISTYFKDREASKAIVADAVHSIIEHRTGNYLVFFPSYTYMEMVAECFLQEYPDIELQIQSPRMDENEREDFLEMFKTGNSHSLVGFAVMGGIFGEGIDLVGKRLSTAVIVGVGLPGICLERELIRDYFQAANGNGFEFAYTYPGINRVLQAVGRVIRTEKDKGTALLIDKRFSTPRYRALLPVHWDCVRVADNGGLVEKLEEFWSS
ncbi:MAG: DEAD/DEAH box helicase [Desulfobacteraceae bacterium]|nr:DEAD/DEAH box helicase [Desulfobacteraceae bacterium]